MCIFMQYEFMCYIIMYIISVWCHYYYFLPIILSIPSKNNIISNVILFLNIASQIICAVHTETEQLFYLVTILTMLNKFLLCD